MNSTKLPLYLSTNAGVTWQTNTLTSTAWSCVASSADGTKLAAANDAGPIYTSTNSGATWTSNNVPRGYFQAIASSADGTVLLAATDFNNTSTGAGAVYSSIDSGVTWVSNSFNGTFWQGVTASADGKKWTACGVVPPSYKGGIYASPPEVLLAGLLSPGDFIASWSTNGNGFALEQSSAPIGAPWFPVTNSIATTNGNYQVGLPLTGSSVFFRLKQ
jgi:hypothetical protein